MCITITIVTTITSLAFILCFTLCSVAMFLTCKNAHEVIFNFVLPNMVSGSQAQNQIRMVATTPEKTHNQKFLTFGTILNRFLVQFYPGFYPPPTLFGGPLCERTERDRDMKISGFVDLDTANAFKYVKI